MIQFFDADGNELGSFGEMLNSAVSEALTEHFKEMLAPFEERIAASGGYVKVILRQDRTGATLDLGEIPEGLAEEIRQAIQ